MPPRHRFALALSLPLSLAAMLAALWLPALPAPLTPIVVPNPEFDAARAGAQLARWTAQFPRRVVGSASSAAFRAQLQTELADLGLTVTTQPFSVTVASQARAGVNVLAGEAAGGLLLTAAYDTAEFGGRDNLAAVAALLELARVFAPQRLPIAFLFADSGEYGQAAGSQAYLAAAPPEARPWAVLSLEALAGQDWERLRVEGAGYLTGYAPVELRKLGLEAARFVGAAAAEPQGAEEALVRALPFKMTGPGLWLAAGVPALGFSTSPLPAAGVSLQKLGQAAEYWTRSLAARRGLVPAGAAGDWRLDDTRQLPAWAAGLVTLLAFGPLFTATAIAGWAERPARQLLWPELVAWWGASLPVLNGLAAVFIVLRLGWLPGYERFPAAPGDPFLLQPADWVMLLSLAVAGVSAWDIWRARGWGRLAERLAVPSRRLTLLLALSLTALMAWALNGFAAALLLAPAGALWPWIQPSRFPAGRALNVWLALGGLLPLAAVVAGLALTPGLGLAWWFLTLGAVYGLYPWPAVAVFAVSAGLCLRFIRLGTQPAAQTP